MYCVIQEVPSKRTGSAEPKEIIAAAYSWTIQGESGEKYYYRMSDEHFARPEKKSFRISIHRSYRENGKVRKQQVALCTIGYYDIVDFGGWYHDFICGGALEAKREALGIPEEELDAMVCAKLDPVIERVWEDFRQTEEWKARQEHRAILEEYRRRKAAFAEKWETDADEYDYIYDVFGKLRNPEHLKKVKTDYKARREYEKQSRSYYRNQYSSYSGNASGSTGSSYGTISSGNYTEQEKAILKQFYRELSKRFHPDSNPDRDTSEHMKLLNQLKVTWGL